MRRQEYNYNLETCELRNESPINLHQVGVVADFETLTRSGVLKH